MIRLQAGTRVRQFIRHVLRNEGSHSVHAGVVLRRSPLLPPSQPGQVCKIMASVSTDIASSGEYATPNPSADLLFCLTNKLVKSNNHARLKRTGGRVSSSVESEAGVRTPRGRFGNIPSPTDDNNINTINTTTHHHQNHDHLPCTLLRNSNISLLSLT